MNPIFKNILAVITGLIVGSIVNMMLVKIGHLLLPVKGLDPNNMSQLAEIMATLDAKYFVFPFLAHSLGTLIGALIAHNVAAAHKMKFALMIGGFFLLGGIMVSRMIPAPTWFVVADILLAYIPMAWIGGKLAAR